MVDALHVDAARQHVRGHEHVGGAAHEVVERAAALVLAAVGVDGLGRVARLLQTAARGVGTAAGAGEHDDALVPLLGQHRLQQGRLERLRGADDELLHRVGRLALVGYLHHGRVVQELSHAAHDGAVDGGREQERLPAGGRRPYDLAHGGQKAHVQHAVRLVEHEHLHVAQARGPLVHEVHEAAGRGDEHVGAVLELLDLRLVGQAAHHGGYAVVGGHGHGGAHLADLLRQLARGRDHQHERPLPALRVPEPVQGGQRERGRLARAGLGGRNEVAALQHQRDGLLLHGGGHFIAQTRHGVEDFRGQPQLVEFCHRYRLRSFR